MGLLANLRTHLLVTIVVFLVLTFTPGLPPFDMDFTAYTVKPTLPLEGRLAINNKLNNAERLFEDELKGPESLAVYKDELYTGIHGGHIVKIKNGKLIPVFKFGKSCEGIWEEEKCGRVLGLKFVGDTLFAADAYYGLFKVNITSGKMENLAKKDDIIAGKKNRLPNSVDVTSDGTVYWTISSTTHNLSDGVYTFLGDGNGCFMKYNPKTKKHEVLMENLHFANGVVLSEDESFILVAETQRARIWKYHLKGPKKGVADIFIDGLPGLPDNLKSDDKGGFFISLIIPIDKDVPYLSHTISTYPSVRKFIVRLLTLIEVSLEHSDQLFGPNYYLRRAIHFIGHFESMSFLSGKRVTIIRVDKDGEIIESFHATDGRISGICEIQYFKGAYYLASPFNSYLAKVIL